MTRHKKILILLALGLVVGLAVWHFGRDREPSYNGRTVTQWLLIYEDPWESSDPSISSSQAAAALRQFGTNAIPYLLRHLERVPSPSEQRIINVLELLPDKLTRSRIVMDFAWRAGFETQSPGPWVGFIALGPIATPAVPDLQRIIAATNVPGNITRAAIYALLEIGPDVSFPILSNVIVDGKPQERAFAVYSLGRMRQLGETNNPATTLLLSCINSTNSDMADSAVHALGRLNVDANIVVPALEEALHAPRVSTRSAAATSLARFGVHATPAIDSLRSLLNDPSQNVQFAASNALIEITASLTNSPPQ